MRCSKCQNQMVELFTSWACDHCEGKTVRAAGSNDEDWIKKPGIHVVELLSLRSEFTSEGYFRVHFEVRNKAQPELVHVFYRSVIHDRGFSFAQFCVQDINHILNAFEQYDFHQYAAPRTFATNCPTAQVSRVEKTTLKGRAILRSTFSKVTE